MIPRWLVVTWTIGSLIAAMCFLVAFLMAAGVIGHPCVGGDGLRTTCWP